MRSEQEVNHAIERYADLVFRLCMVKLKSNADAEDIFQNVFLKYALSNQEFDSTAHEKAWLIRVTLNACKDHLRGLFRRRTIPLDEVADAPETTDEQRAVLEAVRSLPKEYRDVVYLHYYEGYTAPEIAEITQRNTNTVYTHLTRARQMLRELLGGEHVE